MNKTLEEIVLEEKKQFHWFIQTPGTVSDFHKFLDSFAEQVWNAALTACREKMPEEITKHWNEWTQYGDTEHEANSVYFGRNEYREKALTAIDSLKT